MCDGSIMWWTLTYSIQLDLIYWKCSERKKNEKYECITRTNEYFRFDLGAVRKQHTIYKKYRLTIFTKYYSLCIWVFLWIFQWFRSSDLIKLNKNPMKITLKWSNKQFCKISNFGWPKSIGSKSIFDKLPWNDASSSGIGLIPEFKRISLINCLIFASFITKNFSSALLSALFSLK